MRKNILMALFLLLLVGAGGCILSLHSLFKPEDLQYESALVGKWLAQDMVWTFTALDEQSGRYTLNTQLQEQPPGEFSASFGVINSRQFLEIMPTRPEAIHTKTFLGGHFVTLRSFWRVTLAGDDLTLTPLSGKWLEEMLKQSKISIAQAKTDNGLCFLTATTEEIRQFLSEFGGDNGAFPVEGAEKGLQFVRAAKP